MKSKEFLKKYLDAYAPVAQETEGQTIWLDYVKQFADSTSIDAYGTGMAVRLASHRDSKTETKKVVIEAHCDEIAWIITHIEDSGYIRVKRHGGSDNLIAPSKSVIIHTHNGKKSRRCFWLASNSYKRSLGQRRL